MLYSNYLLFLFINRFVIFVTMLLLIETNIRTNSSFATLKTKKYELIRYLFYKILTMNDIEFKKFRKNTKLTQKEFADKLGFNVRTIQKWEKGDIEISKKNLMRIMSEFSSYFTRINSPGKSNNILSNNATVLSEKNVDYFINNYGDTFYVKDDHTIELELLFIPSERYTDYIEMHTNEKELKGNFTTTRFHVNQIETGNFKSFGIVDDAMNDFTFYATPANAVTLCRELNKDKWLDQDYKNDYGWIFVTNDDVVFRNVKGLNLITGDFGLIAKNPDYIDFNLNTSEILQIFEVIKRAF